MNAAASASCSTLAGVTCAEVADHMGWVQRQAQALVRHLPANVERSDLVQVGLIAVAKSLTTFEWGDDRDSELAHDAFVRYARMRVKGAMLDELRTMDYLTRSERRNVKRIQAARERCRAECGREPGLAELARRTGIDETEIGQLLQADALGRRQADVDADGDEPANHPATAPGAVEDRVATTQAMRHFTAFLERLPDRELMVIEAYLGTGPGPIATAAALQVTPSRVSQMYYAVLRRISRQAWAAGQVAKPAAAVPAAAVPAAAVPAAAVRHKPSPAARFSAEAGPTENLFASDIVRGCDASLLR